MTNPPTPQEQVRPQFLLIVNTDDNRVLIMAFATEAERDAATLEAIYGPGGPAPFHKDCDVAIAELEELRRGGELHFEGDPSIYWKTGWVESASTSALQKRVQELERDLDGWRNREASVCSEDRSFEETIQSLRTTIAALTEEKAVLQSQVENADGVLEQVRLIHRQRISTLEQERDGLKAWKKIVIECEPSLESEGPENFEGYFVHWDTIVNYLKNAWPGKLLSWGQCPSELIFDLINERDEANSHLTAMRQALDRATDRILCTGKHHGHSFNCEIDHDQPRYQKCTCGLSSLLDAINAALKSAPGQELMGDKELSNLWRNLSDWSQKTFGTDTERGPIGPLKHLIKEVGEAMMQPKDLTEYADCLILIFDATRRAGFTFEQLVNEATAKHQINTTRTYPKPAGDEVSEHVRGGDCQKLHLALDTLAAQFIESTGQLLGKTTVIDLMVWSNNRQAIDSAKKGSNE